jgi:Ethanolamine utilization protein EutJ (predicted chaperonin)
MERYVLPSSLDANEERIRYRILDESQAYLKSLEVLDETTHSEGIHEVKAKVLVDVGKLATSLRNLQVTLRLLAPGADQAVEGRRRAPRVPQEID